jgi:hypothetical protein
MNSATALAVSTLIAMVPVTGQADYLQVANDTLSWSDGEIIASPGTSWDGPGTTLEYTVYFDEDSENWKYRYEWSTSHKSLSHMIFSLTEDGDLGAFGYDNLLGGTAGGEIKYYGPDDPSNPGIPGDMYGIKFDTDDDDLDAYFEIITDRGPMWGDFYAKGGVEMLAIQALPVSKKLEKLRAKAEAGTLKEKKLKKLAKLEAKHENGLRLVSMSEAEQAVLGKKDKKLLKKLTKKMGNKPDREKASMFAYNAGFGNENDIWFNPDGTLAEYIADQILVPDSFEGPVPPSAIVPVPAAAWLFVSGLLGLVGFARRRGQA